jgi:hypothetical protein
MKRNTCAILPEISMAKETFFLNQLSKMVREKQIRTLSIGDRIHLHSMNGTYRVSFLYKKGVEITCNKWEVQGRDPMYIEHSDFKCYAHNKFSTLPLLVNLKHTTQPCI